MFQHPLGLSPLHQFSKKLAKRNIVEQCAEEGFPDFPGSSYAVATANIATAVATATVAAAVAAAAAPSPSATSAGAR